MQQDGSTSSGMQRAGHLAVCADIGMECCRHGLLVSTQHTCLVMLQGCHANVTHCLLTSPQPWSSHHQEKSAALASRRGRNPTHDSMAFDVGYGPNLSGTSPNEPHRQCRFFSIVFLHGLQVQTCLRTYECHCPQSYELQPLKLKP